jgi:hypothetical protein
MRARIARKISSSAERTEQPRAALRGLPQFESHVAQEEEEEGAHLWAADLSRRQPPSYHCRRSPENRLVGGYLLGDLWLEELPAADSKEIK